MKAMAQPRNPKKEAAVERLVKRQRWHDSRIARRLNVPLEVVGEARRNLGLPAVRHPKIPARKLDQIKELVKEGRLSDQAIVEKLNAESRELHAQKSGLGKRYATGPIEITVLVVKRMRELQRLEQAQLTEQRRRSIRAPANEKLELLEARTPSADLLRTDVVTELALQYRSRFSRPGINQLLEQIRKELDTLERKRLEMRLPAYFDQRHALLIQRDALREALKQA